MQAHRTVQIQRERVYSENVTSWWRVPPSGGGVLNALNMSRQQRTHSGSSSCLALDCLEFALNMQDQSRRKMSLQPAASFLHHTEALRSNLESPA